MIQSYPITFEMQFVFSTVSEAQIQRSRGGNEMLAAINYDGPRDQVITGRPGSGKTTITVMRARRLTALGKNILLLTKHKLLVYSLKKAYRTVYSIYGIDEWFAHITRGKWLSHYTTGAEIKKLITPTAFRYDEVLVDEGQDLPAYMYEAFPFAGNRFLVGADTAQRIYPDGADAATIEATLVEQGRVIKPTELQYNYRNYVETYTFARQFVPEVGAAQSGLIIANTTKGAGGQERLPRVIQVVNKFARLANLLEENSAVNVAIVLFHRDEVQEYYDELTRRGFECSLYYNGMEEDERQQVAADMQSIVITTYKSVKGQEFPVVIMPAMEQAQTQHYHYPSLYYVGCTRATERLYLLYQGRNLPDCLASFDKSTYRHIQAGDVWPQPSAPILKQPKLDEDAPF